VTSEKGKRKDTGSEFILKSDGVIAENAISFVNIDIGIPNNNRTNSDAIALIIGNSNYSNNIPDVDFAINDAKTVKRYLIDAMGYQEHNIIFLENADKVEMELALGNDKKEGKLAKYIKPGLSDVFVYFSGHGAPDIETGNAFLVPVNAHPLSFQITAYPLETLYDNLSKMDAKSVTVVIDACFSGQSGSQKAEMLIKNASPIGIKVTNPTAKLKNGVLITASSEKQLASWLPQQKHGLLTYFYLLGLRGEADLNKDNIVTSEEMKEYLRNRSNSVPYWANRLYGREQFPEVYFIDKNIPLIILK